jgi:catechol 2,3-dioxygenase-like lactoylglutathione lyase family enzyme
MPSIFRFDHIHLLSREPEATADYYVRMFDATATPGVTKDGRPRIDLKLGELDIFIFKIQPDEAVPAGPSGRYLGLDHFGLIVDDFDAVVAELERRGVEFAVAPKTMGPGHKVAFLKAPENVRIEVLQRG